MRDVGENHAASATGIEAASFYSPENGAAGDKRSDL
jgi:hypothetical protein